jgi:hypothetical protein
MTFSLQGVTWDYSFEICQNNYHIMLTYDL